MDKVVLNLDGGGFFGDRSACLGKPSRLVAWDRTLRADAPTVHVDGYLLQKPLPGPGPHWAWLLETPAITKDVVKLLPQVAHQFERIFTHSTVAYMWDSRGVAAWAPACGIWIRQPRIRDKSRVVSMFTSPKANLDGHKHRLQWAERMQSFNARIPALKAPHMVDIFGLNGRVPYKEMGLNDYMFSVAIENARAPGYFTEKLLDCFATGTVPIYYGAPDIGDFFNKDGIIELVPGFDPGSLDRERYERMLPAVRENFERCLQYEIPEDYIARRYGLPVTKGDPWARLRG